MKALATAIVLIILTLPAHAAQVMGELARLDGTAEVELPRLRQLAPGDRVLDGDTVHTGPQARLLFHMQDQTRLSLGEETRFTFEAAQLDNDPTTLRLLQGAFRLATDTTDLTVETPLGTIGIRGTDFWGGFFKPDEFGVFLFTGKAVTVHNPHGKVTLLPGQGTTLRPDQPPTEPATWGEARLEQARKMVQFQ